jgi:hypothetical protein
MGAIGPKKSHNPTRHASNDTNAPLRGVVIKTHEQSVHNGKVYYLRCEDEQADQDWLMKAEKLHQIAVRTFSKRVCFAHTQRRIAKIYDHFYFQTFIASMILGSFVLLCCA